MTATLALKYRPTTFADVVGQALPVAVLRAMVAKGEIPASLLLQGPMGTGKTTLARIFGAALNCPDVDKGAGCGVCSVCADVQAGAHPNVVEIDAASHGGVADVAAIREMCSFHHSDGWHVIVFDEAQSMSREAFNALLKLIEEPPERTVFVLVSTQPEKILGPVRSRSTAVELRLVPQAIVQKRLQIVCDAENLSVGPEVLEAVAKRSKGHLRDALVMLSHVALTEAVDIDRFGKVFGNLRCGPEVVLAIACGDTKGALTATEDFMAEGGSLDLWVEEMIGALLDVSAHKVGLSRPQVAAAAQRLSRHQIAAALKIFWAFLGQPRYLSALLHARLLIDMAMAAAEIRAAEVPVAAPGPILSIEPPGSDDLARAMESLGLTRI